MKKEQISWETLSEENLLKTRICDLRLRIEDTPLQAQVQQLYEELSACGLEAFKPQIYLGDEWFSPEGLSAIAIPFYLAHPRLRALEEKMMLEVEGGNDAWCMRLLRHEAGHCFDHVFRFSRRSKWKRIFGSPNAEYHPETYRPRPYSRSYVKNLDNWYAQAHPDEDFAETFAVWLNPKSDWVNRYRKWPVALKKLQYIDSLVKEAVKNPKAPEKVTRLPYSINRLKSTLEKYYQKRKKENAQDYPDFFDKDLKRIFSGENSLNKREFSAKNFLRKNRKAIISSVSYWSRERKFTVTLLVRKLIDRCDQLNLRLGKNEAETNLEVAAYLSTLVTHYLFTGKFKRSV